MDQPWVHPHLPEADPHREAIQPPADVGVAPAQGLQGHEAGDGVGRPGIVGVGVGGAMIAGDDGDGPPGRSRVPSAVKASPGGARCPGTKHTKTWSEDPGGYGRWKRSACWNVRLMRATPPGGAPLAGGPCLSERGGRDLDRGGVLAGAAPGERHRLHPASRLQDPASRLVGGVVVEELHQGTGPILEALALPGAVDVDVAHSLHQSTAGGVLSARGRKQPRPQRPGFLLGKVLRSQDHNFARTLRPLLIIVALTINKAWLSVHTASAQP